MMVRSEREWITRRPHKLEHAGSNPVSATKFFDIPQIGEPESERCKGVRPDGVRCRMVLSACRHLSGPRCMKKGRLDAQSELSVPDERDSAYGSPP